MRTCGVHGANRAARLAAGCSLDRCHEMTHRACGLLAATLHRIRVCQQAVHMPNSWAARSVAKTATERVIGTITGGILGFTVRAAGELVDTRHEFLLYAAAAAAVGGMGVYLQDAMPQAAGAAKLLVITFLLVFAGSDSIVRRRGLCALAVLFEQPSSCAARSSAGALAIQAAVHPAAARKHFHNSSVRACTTLCRADELT
jgi:hypothetical protein